MGFCEKDPAWGGMFLHHPDGKVMQLLSDEVVVTQRISNEKARPGYQAGLGFHPSYATSELFDTGPIV